MDLLDFDLVPETKLPWPISVNFAFAYLVLIGPTIVGNVIGFKH